MQVILFGVGTYSRFILIQKWTMINYAATTLTPFNRNVGHIIVLQDQFIIVFSIEQPLGGPKLSNFIARSSSKSNLRHMVGILELF